MNLTNRDLAIIDLRWLADNGLGKDIDLVWGTQCTDLDNFVMQKYDGVLLYGNALNLLDSAAAQGYDIYWAGTGFVPIAGAIFVMATGDQYGHTGVVIEDYNESTGIMLTVEQNVDGYSDSNGNGINDQYEFGGPARYVHRRLDNVIGWFYPKYDKPQFGQAPKYLGDGRIIEQHATMTVTVDMLNIRTAPSLKAEIKAAWMAGGQINYDQVIWAEGYIWISYIAHSGNRVYCAAGEADDKGNNILPFGKFK